MYIRYRADTVYDLLDAIHLSETAGLIKIRGESS